jgi:hypothetical protein
MLEKRHVRYSFEGKRYLKLSGTILAEIQLKNNLPVLVHEVNQNYFSLHNIHSSLGHIAPDKIKHLPIKVDTTDTYPCDICEIAKTTRKTPVRKYEKAHRHLYEVIHSDICQMPITSIDGFKYFAVFVDSGTRFVHVVLLQRKSDIYVA